MGKQGFDLRSEPPITKRDSSLGMGMSQGTQAWSSERVWRHRPFGLKGVRLPRAGSQELSRWVQGRWGGAAMR